MNFDKLTEIIDDAYKNHAVPCSDIVVTHNNEVVYRYMNGTSDDNKSVPIKGDEMYFLYSASKVITCTAALQLVEKGLIGLDDDLSKYISEFANMNVKTKNGLAKAQKPIKIRNLFSMTSGLNYNVQSDSILAQIEKNPASTTLEIVKAIANEPLECEPGEHFIYSLSHDVLAAVVEVASGIRFDEYVKKNIFDVCGMKNTYFQPTEEVLSRVCAQYQYVPEMNSAKLMEKENSFILTPNYMCGGAGIISCVDDYIKFASAMANGETLLKKETINLMRSNQLGEQALKDFDTGCKPGYAYGLGVRTNVASDFSAKGEFGWDGAAGSYTLIDPDNHIAVFYATHIRNYGGYLYGDFHLGMRDEIYKQILG